MNNTLKILLRQPFHRNTVCQAAVIIFSLFEIICNNFLFNNLPNGIDSCTINRIYVIKDTVDIRFSACGFSRVVCWIDDSAGKDQLIKKNFGNDDKINGKDMLR